MPSLWTSKSAIARSDFVDVVTTRPFPALEYIRPLFERQKQSRRVAGECAKNGLVMVVVVMVLPCPSRRSRSDSSSFKSSSESGSFKVVSQTVQDLVSSISTQVVPYD